MSLSTYLSMTERMMELDQPYSRKRTHQDLVNIAGTIQPLLSVYTTNIYMYTCRISNG